MTDKGALKHAGIRTWVDEIAAMTRPDRILFIDGSEDEKQQLIKESLATGELIELNQQKMTWSFQFEKGCVPAAAICRPSLSALCDSSRRMRQTSCSSSVTSAQILVPTSTIDWCSSRLI